MGLFHMFKKNKKEDMEHNMKEKDITPPKKSNKRKTIPKEVKELVKAGKDEEVKVLMKKCQANAYDTYYKNTILCYDGLSDNLLYYFLQEGYDINYVGRWSETPLHHQASNICPNLQSFLEAHANIHALNYMKKTPLHCATMYSKLENVKVLVNAGADVNAKSDGDVTPLHELLSRMHLFHAQTSLDCITYLLEHGAKITPMIKDVIKRIGKDFEFHKKDMKPDVLEEAQTTMNFLYQTFHVEPMAPRVLFDGISPIKVNATSWQEAHEELWQLLVPSRGNASTIQGELIRISGKVSYEIIDNGACNWDGEYRKMLKEVPLYLQQGKLLPTEEMKELESLLTMLSKGRGEEEVDRFVQLMVHWVFVNPEPIALTEVGYKR